MPHELCIEEGRPTGGRIGWIEEGEEEEIQDGRTDDNQQQGARDLARSAGKRMTNRARHSFSESTLNACLSL